MHVVEEEARDSYRYEARSKASHSCRDVPDINLHLWACGSHQNNLLSAEDWHCITRCCHIVDPKLVVP